LEQFELLCEGLKAREARFATAREVADEYR
jgi:hypothetical protein